MRLLGLVFGGRQIRNALAQQDFNGAQLSHGEAYFTEGALVKPIDKLTGSDFFPDVIGMKEHFAFCHLFLLLHQPVAKLTCIAIGLFFEGALQGVAISNLPV
jgi:hypothetical protein